MKFLSVRSQRLCAAVVLTLCSTLIGCVTRPGAFVKRQGDEIMVCGQMVHTGAPVVLWTDPGGYDAYRVERRFVPYERSSWTATTQDTHDVHTPNRFDLRDKVLTTQEVERVRGGGWDLALLQEKVDQFVIHYDGSGTSRGCFKTLQDARGLSVHFMLDLDGTIYQTLDLKEKAWHATTSNSRSIGIEIANYGAYQSASFLKQWYATDESGHTRVTIPATLGNGGERTPGFVAQPIRDGLVHGILNGESLVQYDFTPEQYASLIKLTATLCTVFPKIRCDYPRDAHGCLVTQKLPDDELASYHGLLGHLNVQSNKVDPGPAFQWNRVVEGARALMR